MVLLLIVEKNLLFPYLSSCFEALHDCGRAVHESVGDLKDERRPALQVRLCV